MADVGASRTERERRQPTNEVQSQHCEWKWERHADGAAFAWPDGSSESAPAVRPAATTTDAFPNASSTTPYQQSLPYPTAHIIPMNHQMAVQYQQPAPAQASYLLPT
ncbi:unnamed protein product, partial [Mesorhabditis spiculigera]